MMIERARRLMGRVWSCEAERLLFMGAVVLLAAFAPVVATLLVLASFALSKPWDKEVRREDPTKPFRGDDEVRCGLAEWTTAPPPLRYVEGGSTGDSMVAEARKLAVEEVCRRFALPLPRVPTACDDPACLCRAPRDVAMGPGPEV